MATATGQRTQNTREDTKLHDEASGIMAFLSKGRRLPTLCFALFFGWLLSLPFEGGVFLAIAEQYPGLDPRSIVVGATEAHFIGLFSCGYLFPKRRYAKRLILVCGLICMAGSTVFLFHPSKLWMISILTMALTAGFVVASWSFWLVSETPKGGRLRMCADILIYSNVIMILCNMVAANLSALGGLLMTILVLAGALILVPMLPERPEGTVMDRETADPENANRQHITPWKPLLNLYLFVTIITINSGLMYSVVGPAFEQHKFLTSFYWAVPYIVALAVMKKLQKGTKRQYLLTLALVMIGLSFILFAILDRSAISYIIIDTLMLGACGFCDIFWWSILGEMLDYAKTPPRMFGIGLSANILGIIFGSFVAEGIHILGGGSLVAMTNIAVGVVFVIILILPLLYRQLSTVLHDHAFAVEVMKMPEQQQHDLTEDLLSGSEFTDREREIMEKLLQGKPYRLVAEELFVSENTIKFHMKNIYSKLGVHNRTELLKTLEAKRVRPGEK